jgi:hypothetical protein
VLLSGIMSAAWAVGSPQVTMFFESNKAKIDGLYLGDTAYYPLEPMLSVSKSTYTWDPSKLKLEINGREPKDKPLVVGDKVFLTLESFVQASGLLPIWDLGRGVVMLQREKINVPTATQGFSTPNNPGNVLDANELPFDSTLNGRMPAGWNFKNPLVDNAPPTSSNGPLVRTPGMAANVLDRKKGQSGDVYIPRSSANASFSVTVTDVDRCDNLRGYYQPRSGYRFLLIHVSQKNVTNFPQVDPGKFYLQDNNGNTYEHLEEMSTHRPVILRPYGLNFGYLVFELPETTLPSKLILTCVGQPPLGLTL